MKKSFAKPFTHRMVGDDRAKKDAQQLLLEQRVQDYVSTKAKERGLEIPVEEKVIALPSVAAVAATPLVAPVGVPLFIYFSIKQLVKLDYD